MMARKLLVIVATAVSLYGWIDHAFGAPTKIKWTEEVQPHVGATQLTGTSEKSTLGPGNTQRWTASGQTPNDIQTSNTINGDLKPQLDSNGNPKYDNWGNVISDGQASPGRADTLYDTSANDRIEAGSGNDTVWKVRSGDDVINLGAGDDHLFTTFSGDGRIVANGGDGRDYLGAGSGQTYRRTAFNSRRSCCGY